MNERKSLTPRGLSKAYSEDHVQKAGKGPAGERKVGERAYVSRWSHSATRQGGSLRVGDHQRAAAVSDLIIARPYLINR